MKLLNKMGLGLVAGVALAVPSLVLAGGTNSVAPAKPTPYPLDTCLISGEKLGGDMGEPVVFVYTNNGANQEIKFCCPMCKPKFLAHPDKYMKIIKDAEATKQAKK